MLIKLEDGRMKDVSIVEVNKDNYIVPPGEEHSYHVKLEIVAYSPTNGKRLSRPFVQKFDKKMFEGLMAKQLPLQGYTVEILYNPTDYLKRKEAEKAEVQKKIQQAKLKDEESKKKEFKKVVAKAVAEEIAQLSKKSKGKTNAD